MWKVPLFDLNYDSKEEEAAQEVLRGRWLTMGEKTQQFELEFSNMLGGAPGCVAVSSATAALHMALLALGVETGDEVVIPALTFVADANVVRMVGAKPILADAESSTNWNVSAATIAPRITEKTKAVIVVHFAGYPCDMKPIAELCDNHKIALIEDVAHAPGASVDSRMCGTIGDIGCFSFFSNKNLSVGEGGMVVSNDEKLVARLRSLRSHGMTTQTLDRHKGRANSYDVMQVGLNYRMDEIRAAIGLVQLEKLPTANKRRMQLTQIYMQRLAGTTVDVPFSELELLPTAAYHIMPVLLPEKSDRNRVISKLREQGIQTSIHYPPFWNFTAYGEQTNPADAPNVAMICDRELTLPLFPTMSEEQVTLVVSALLSAIDE